MRNVKIIPVILAGGSGSRLWPVSREDVPKQFCVLDHEFSLFQRTIRRVQNEDLFLQPIIVTGDRYSQMVRTQLEQVACSPRAIICEPAGRDTSAAVLAAAEVAECYGDELMLVMPSDHLMDDEGAFIDAIKAACACQDIAERIVTFGIKPSSPETGFGYIRAGSALGASSVRELDSFIEKPSLPVAEELIRDPEVFWNAGIFLFKPETVLDEGERYCPEVARSVRMAVSNGVWLEKFFHPDATVFCSVPPISFDYAIMERTDRAAMLSVDPKWSDLGSWKAIWEVSPKQADGNVLGDNCFVEDAENCLVRSDGPTVGVAGLEDVVVVANRDAVLVTSRKHPQGVKGLVETMKSSGVSASVSHSGEDRSWGRFDSIDAGDTHLVKRIRVEAGKHMSLRYHNHRSEHWVVVAGAATATVGEQVRSLGVGDQVFIPQGTIYKLDNFTKEAVELIEIQIGKYLGEDDIVRIDETSVQQNQRRLRGQQAA